MKFTAALVLASALAVAHAQQAPADKAVTVGGTKATLTTSQPGVLNVKNKSAAPYTCPKGSFHGNELELC